MNTASKVANRIKICLKKSIHYTHKAQRGRGHWAVYYTSNKVNNNGVLFIRLTTLGTFIEV